MTTVSTSRPRVLGQAGQASIELVALAPLLVLLALAAAQLLAAGASAELADNAAEAGAVALLQEADPRAAARDSLPGWATDRASVRVDGRRVRVRLRPPSPMPALGRLLEARGEADAGRRWSAPERRLEARSRAEAAPRRAGR